MPVIRQLSDRAQTRNLYEICWLVLSEPFAYIHPQQRRNPPPRSNVCPRAGQIIRLCDKQGGSCGMPPLTCATQTPFLANQYSLFFTRQGAIATFHQSGHTPHVCPHAFVVGFSGKLCVSCIYSCQCECCGMLQALSIVFFAHAIGFCPDHVHWQDSMLQTQPDSDITLRWRTITGHTEGKNM